MTGEDCREVNRLVWDERAAAHAASPGYQVQRFLDDPAYVSDVVRFALPRLGGLDGVREVHLQCHIGTDTVSLSRRGARMTGHDFSERSLEQARGLTAATGAESDFVRGDVHDTVEVLGGDRFDLVYTGVGALCWLPSAARWAQVVAGLLRPGGRLHLREGHPVLWALDERCPDGRLRLEHPYVETESPMVGEEPGTCVETEVTFTHGQTLEGNHRLGGVVTALLDAGLVLTALVEQDSVPWKASPGLMEELPGVGEWRLRDRPERLPHTYTLQAIKPG